MLAVSAQEPVERKCNSLPTYCAFELHGFEFLGGEATRNRKGGQNRAQSGQSGAEACLFRVVVAPYPALVQRADRRAVILDFDLVIWNLFRISDFGFEFWAKWAKSDFCAEFRHFPPPAYKYS